MLARVSGAFIYVPLPGIKAGPEVARVVFALSLTFVLFPSWPVIDARGVNIAILMGWMLAEAGIGIAVGLAVAFLTEGFQMGAQIISLQAGYSFRDHDRSDFGRRFERAALDRATYRGASVLRHRARPAGASDLRAEPDLASAGTPGGVAHDGPCPDRARRNDFRHGLAPGAAPAGVAV